MSTYYPEPLYVTQQSKHFAIDMHGNPEVALIPIAAFRSAKEAEQFATFLAAAPELFEHMKKLESILTRLYNGEDMDLAVLAIARDMATARIKKAEGE